MSKPDLFICHTAYQVMVDFLRAMRSPVKPVLLLAAVVPGAEELAEKLMASGAVEQTVVFDESRCEMANFGVSPLGLLRQHGADRRAVEKAGLRLTPADYAHIYIHNDWSVLGKYLQAMGTEYILCEDTFASTCWPRHPLIEEQRAKPGFALRQRLSLGYLYWGDYRGVTAVETEDAERCPIFPEKRLPHSKSELLHSLTEKEKAALLRLFLSQPLPEKAENACILMTHSFVQDGTMKQSAQDSMWRAVVEKYRLDGPLFIKAHPRDACDYKALFPEATVLQRTMPSEVLNFALPFRFARAVTVQSTVLGSFEPAEEKIHLTTEEALALAE